MRKSYFAKRAAVGLLIFWGALTGYKVTRRVLQKKVNPMPASVTEKYYSMPRTKQERRAELGRSTWAFLHITAAKYPVTPTREDMSNAIRLIDVLTKMFPCSECREHFKQLVSSFPPRVSSQEEFSMWMCEAHNIVNRRLGKPIFDCSRLDDRWDCGCK